MTDHNTLDDLVRVARAYVPMCGHYPCAGYATSWVAHKPLCDEHAAEWSGETGVAAVDTADWARVRRLIKAGVL